MAKQKKLYTTFFRGSKEFDIVESTTHVFPNEYESIFDAVKDLGYGDSMVVVEIKLRNGVFKQGQQVRDLRILQKKEVNRLIKREVGITGNFNLHDCDLESKYIYNSKFIEDSKYVFSSEHIKASSDIAQSSFLDHCKNVVGGHYSRYSENMYDGLFINDSENIYSSYNVSQSFDVFEGHHIHASGGIYQSFNIDKSLVVLCSNTVVSSHVVNNCFEVVASYFLDTCDNMRNSIFCRKLQDKQYYVFNKKVKPDRYCEIHNLLGGIKVMNLGFVDPKSDAENINHNHDVLNDLEFIVPQYFDFYKKLFNSGYFNMFFKLKEFDVDIFCKITKLDKNEIQKIVDKNRRGKLL